MLIDEVDTWVENLRKVCDTVQQTVYGFDFCLTCSTVLEFTLSEVKTCEILLP